MLCVLEGVWLVMTSATKNQHQSEDQSPHVYLTSTLHNTRLFWAAFKELKSSCHNGQWVYIVINVVSPI